MDIKAEKPPDDAPPPRGSRWSIVKRLILGHTVAAAVILTIAGFFFYWQILDDLRQADDQFLVDEIVTLRSIVRDNWEDKDALQRAVEVERTMRPFSKHFVRIRITPDATVETTGMAAVLPPPDKFPSPEPSLEAFRRGVKWESSTGQTFLLTSAFAEFGVNQQGLIQVALDITPELHTLNKYRRGLVLVILLCTGLSAGTAAVLAQRGMQPVSQITRAAQRITASQLSERISSQNWPQELSTLASEFDHMLARLEEAFNRLSQFSADLAHELRTPINNLRGEAEVALSRTRSALEYKQVLESSLEEYSRLSRMIDSLLFLARVEGTRVQAQRSWFDTQKEIRDVLDFYDALAEEKEIGLAFLGKGLLHADVVLFRRALSNLVANAIYYSPKGAKVTVNVQTKPDGEVEVSVTDTGRGIPAEHLEKLFLRFYRVDPSRTKNPAGTGLGLSLVKSIMDLHGGRVTVTSQVDKGSTFTLHFPPESATKLTKM